MDGVSYAFWVGVDWASAEHQVCALDAERAVILEHEYAHSGEGLAALAADLGKLSPGAPERIAVAIETPRGPVVEGLLERGFHVHAINPKQLDRLRAGGVRRPRAGPVWARVRQRALVIAPGAAEPAIAHSALFLPRLRLVVAEREQCATRIEQLLAALEAEPGQHDEHRDVQILRSLPGVGRAVAATMLAEASQALAARDYHALRAISGAAPITRQSGKSARVLMRRGCNGRMRNAVYHWARVCMMMDGHWRARYVALRARGQSHGRALRAIADRLLARPVGMAPEGTLYYPARAKAGAPVPAARRPA